MADNKQRRRLTTSQLEQFKTTTIQHRLEVLKFVLNTFDSVVLIDGRSRIKQATDVQMVFVNGKLKNEALIVT